MNVHIDDKVLDHNDLLVTVTDRRMISEGTDNAEEAKIRYSDGSERWIDVSFLKPVLEEPVPEPAPNYEQLYLEAQNKVAELNEQVKVAGDHLRERREQLNQMENEKAEFLGVLEQLLKPVFDRLIDQALYAFVEESRFTDGVAEVLRNEFGEQDYDNREFRSAVEDVVSNMDFRVEVR